MPSIASAVREILLAIGEDLNWERLQATPVHAVSNSHCILMQHDKYFQDPEGKCFCISTFLNVIPNGEFQKSERCPGSGT